MHTQTHRSLLRRILHSVVVFFQSQLCWVEASLANRCSFRGCDMDCSFRCCDMDGSMPSAVTMANLREFRTKFEATEAVAYESLVLPSEVLKSPLEDLRCPVCLDFPVAPWILSCQHIFCRKCLDSSPCQRCPLCRERTKPTVQLSRPLRSVIGTSTEFRCVEHGCCWEGKGFAAAVQHWNGCALVLSQRDARNLRKCAETFVETRMKLSVRILRCEEALENKDAELKILKEQLAAAHGNLKRKDMLIQDMERMGKRPRIVEEPLDDPALPFPISGACPVTPCGAVLPAGRDPDEALAKMRTI